MSSHGRRHRPVDPKQRVRVSKACDRCKRQKSKCDGTLPCAGCLKSNISCQYSEGSRSKQSQSLTTSSIQKEGNNVLDLKTKLKILEKQLKAPLMSDRASISNNNQKKNFNENYIYSKEKWRVIRTDQNVLLSKLSDLLYNSLTKEDRLSVTPPRLQFYAWNCSGSHFLNPTFFHSAFNNLKDKTLWKDILKSDIRLSRYLVNYFFVEINPLFCILHESVFYKQYENYLSNPNTSSSDDIFVALLYLVYAISIRFTESGFKKNYKKRLEEKLFEIGYEIITKFTFNWDSFELIQAWLLIAFYLRCFYKQNSTYSAVGTALRMCKSMGLDYNNIEEYPNFSSRVELLKAKRIFWSCYTIDKLFGVQSGKISNINDNDYELNYPTWDWEFEKDDWLTKPGLAMIQLAKITKHLQFFKTNNDPLMEVFDCENFENELENWRINCTKLKIFKDFNNLSVFYKNDDIFNNYNSKLGINFSEVLLMQLKFHYYQVYLAYKSKTLYPLINQPNVFALNGLNNNYDFYNFDKLIETNQEILKLYHRLYMEQLLFVPWYLNLYLLFQIGVFSLLFLNSNIQIEKNYKNYIEIIDYFKILRSPTFQPFLDSSDNSHDCDFELEVVNQVPYEVKYQDKFTMVREILFAFKMLNKMIILKNSHLSNLLTNYTDHGSSSINQGNFTQFGFRQNVQTSLNGLGVVSLSILQDFISKQNVEELNESEIPNMMDDPFFLDENQDHYTGFDSIEWFNQWNSS